MLDMCVQNIIYWCVASFLKHVDVRFYRRLNQFAKLVRFGVFFFFEKSSRDELQSEGLVKVVSIASLRNLPERSTMDG